MHAAGVAEQHPVRQPAGEGLGAGGEQLDDLQPRQRGDLLVQPGRGQVLRDPEAGLGGLRRRVGVSAPDGDLDALRRRAEQLEALYRERGYAFARVTGTLAGAVDAPAIDFVVSEGPEVRVASVTFAGNAALTARQLQAAIATRPSSVWEKGLFRQDVLDRDAAALQARMGQEPFASALRDAWRVTDVGELLAAYVAGPPLARHLLAAGEDVNTDDRSTFYPPILPC